MVDRTLKSNYYYYSKLSFTRNNLWTGCTQEQQVSQLAGFAHAASLILGMKVACSCHPRNMIKETAGSSATEVSL